jgi:altronate dehydratase
VRAALRISERDNVATALEALETGRAITVAGQTVVILEAIPSGHKVAILEIRSGEAVIKYGSPIGTATETIMPGRHVHIHNVMSARGRGDLSGAIAMEPGVRLAEPPEIAGTSDAADPIGPGGRRD